ncbi:MAG: hypothetical protein S4CHLAM45_07370 [Chlamydiales bacterium]|nr:hypothetical protein [Chlamydiales bacterium]MCH9620246.1 hypothetical protein [Chlamydiales bacterium]MCH9622844.1 hypothetical protein [Chlamydiales bacterium]
MIDTRFPPQPKYLDVPLYPPIESVGPSTSSLKDTVAAHYDVDRSQILLQRSGSAALMLFLKWLKTQMKKCKVALPAFSCCELCHAVLAAGCEPLFLDFTPTLTLDEKSIDFAASEECIALIWPQLFEERLFAYLKRTKMIVINDEAQLFPLSHPNACRGAVSLFSFGRSKRLGGVGGGGICVHDQMIKIHEIESIENKQFVEKQTKPPLKQHLDQLLEAYPFIKRALIHGPISNEQSSIATAHLKNYLEKREEWIESVTLLKRVIPPNFRPLMRSKNPAIATLCVKDRYQVSTKLATLGIQTTWYYFPLNRLSFLSNYPSEKTPYTDEIAKKILILPFQWRHPNHQKRRLFNALEQTFGI